MCLLVASVSRKLNKKLKKWVDLREISRAAGARQDEGAREI